jgi:hypothetical protein
MDEIKRLIIKEVDCTPDAKTSMISLGVNKTFLATHLLNDNGNDIVEFLDNEQLE